MLRAKTTLVTNPVHRVMVVYGFPTIFDAADCVPQLLPLSPIAMEGLDTGIVGGLRERGLALADIADLPAGNAWLMVEFGATDQAVAMESAQRAAALAPALPGTPSSARLVDDAALMKRLWTVRETGASATSIGRRVEVRSGRGLGRRRRGAAPSRCVSARILDACGSVRLQNQFVRPLRRWLHSRTDHLRSTSRAGLEDVSPSGCVEPVRVRRSPQARHVRARLLFELLKGEVIEDGWQSEAVKDSLDHCLACKGCRGDCPTHVSGVANALMRNPSFRKMSAKSGLAEDVKFPVIAAKTFRNGASAKRLLTQPESATSGTTKPTPVLLWTDTFNDGFTLDVMEAAVEEQVAPK